MRTLYDPIEPYEQGTQSGGGVRGREGETLKPLPDGRIVASEPRGEGH